jgi:hypothetical protein
LMLYLAFHWEIAQPIYKSDLFLSVKVHKLKSNKFGGLHKNSLNS